MASWLDIPLALLLLTGGFFLLTGSVGLMRLPDFFTRLHAPTKATTLGMGCLLLASMGVFGLAHGSLSVHELIITLFLFMTAPISAHMMAKTALHLELPVKDGTRTTEIMDRARQHPSAADSGVERSAGREGGSLPPERPRSGQ